MNGNDYSIIKAANRTLILNTIAEYGTISIVDIIRKISLSRPTVENLIREMLQEGIIEKCGTSKQSASVGRSAQLYQIGCNRYFSIGVDLEYPTIRIAVINLKMQTVYHTQWICSGNNSVDDIISNLIAEIRKAIDSILKGSGQNRQLIGIGIGICGQLDLANKISLNIERIDGWQNIRLAEVLQREFDVPVSLRNDVHMLAMVKKEERMKANVRNYIYISLRSGIGMALFIKGELFTGMMGNAGFLGHTTVNYMGLKCRCGGHGCLETYLNPTRLTQNYEALTQESISYERLMEKFVAQEKTAVGIMKDAYIILGKAISNVIKIVDIHHIVINGLPKVNKDLIISWIYEGIRESTLEAVSRKVHIEDEMLPEEDVAKGGAMLMIRKFFSDPKLNLSPENN